MLLKESIRKYIESAYSLARRNKLLVAFLMAVVFWFWTMPAPRLQCGPDEGMEYAKIVLALNHPDKVQQAWSDQTWFYPQLLSSIFRLTGFQPWIPRMISLAIVVILCGLLIRLMPTAANWAHLIFCWLFLWAWPHVLHLWVSSMIELPAFGLAVISAALLPRAPDEWRYWRFILSGVLFATAVQIKLTALLIAPALLVHLFFVLRAKTRRLHSHEDVSSEWSMPVAGVVGFIAVFCSILLWAPSWSWSALVNNHMTAGSTAQAAKYHFEVTTLCQSPGILLSAVAAIFILWRRNKLHEIACVLALLVTITVVHMIHRPYWYYYGIHFGIVLSIIGGWGAGELFRLAVFKLNDISSNGIAVFSRSASVMLWALVTALWIGFELPNGYEQTNALTDLPRADENEAIEVLKQYRGKVRWAFTSMGIFPSYAGYAIPPEVAVLPLKRFWSGNISAQGVLDVVKRYDCEIIILRDMELAYEKWKQYTDSDYVRVWSGNNMSIFVSKRLNPVPEPINGDWLKELNL